MEDDDKKELTPAQKRLTEEQGFRVIDESTPEGQAELKAMEERVKARQERLRERRAKRDADQSNQDGS